MAWCALSSYSGGDQVFRLLNGTGLCFLKYLHWIQSCSLSDPDWVLLMEG